MPTEHQQGNFGCTLRLFKQLQAILYLSCHVIFWNRLPSTGLWGEGFWSLSQMTSGETLTAPWSGRQPVTGHAYRQTTIFLCTSRLKCHTLHTDLLPTAALHTDIFYLGDRSYQWHGARSQSEYSRADKHQMPTVITSRCARSRLKYPMEPRQRLLRLWLEIL